MISVGILPSEAVTCISVLNVFPLSAFGICFYDTNFLIILQSLGITAHYTLTPLLSPTPPCASARSQGREAFERNGGSRGEANPQFPHGNTAQNSDHSDEQSDP